MCWGKLKGLDKQKANEGGEKFDFFDEPISSRPHRKANEGLELTFEIRFRITLEILEESPITQVCSGKEWGAISTEQSSSSIPFCRENMTSLFPASTSCIVVFVSLLSRRTSEI